MYVLSFWFGTTSSNVNCDGDFQLNTQETLQDQQVYHHREFDQFAGLMWHKTQHWWAFHGWKEQCCIQTNLNVLTAYHTDKPASNLLRTKNQTLPRTSKLGREWRPLSTTVRIQQIRQDTFCTTQYIKAVDENGDLLCNCYCDGQSESGRHGETTSLTISLHLALSWLTCHFGKGWLAILVSV